MVKFNTFSWDCVIEELGSKWENDERERETEGRNGEEEAIVGRRQAKKEERAKRTWMIRMRDWAEIGKGWGRNCALFTARPARGWMVSEWVGGDAIDSSSSRSTEKRWRCWWRKKSSTWKKRELKRRKRRGALEEDAKDGRQTRVERERERKWGNRTDRVGRERLVQPTNKFTVHRYSALPRVFGS